MWGWKPKAWGLQWFSTHCQSLTSCQLLRPPGRIRATGRTHRWVTQEGKLWQQISFSKKQKDFILFALEILSLNNDRWVRVWLGADDPVMVLSVLLWWGGREFWPWGSGSLHLPSCSWWIKWLGHHFQVTWTLHSGAAQPLWPGHFLGS